MSKQKGDGDFESMVETTIDLEGVDQLGLLGTRDANLRFFEE